MLRTLTRTVGSNPTVTARAESVESVIRHSARDLRELLLTPVGVILFLRTPAVFLAPDVSN